MRVLFIVLALFSAFLFSCSKNNPQATRYATVKGQLIDTPNNKPFANTAIIIYGSHPKGILSKEMEEQVIPVTTDNAGNFTTRFNVEKDHSVSIYWPEGISKNVTQPNGHYIITTKTFGIGEYPELVDFGTINTRLKKP
jgi:uncharacterized protein YfaS (alpha-2-macroglobulin family)